MFDHLWRAKLQNCVGESSKYIVYMQIVVYSTHAVTEYSKKTKQKHSVHVNLIYVYIQW